MGANELMEKVSHGGDNIFALSQKVENLALGLGRKQMGNDVLRCLVASIGQQPQERIDAVVALCDAEAHK